MASSLQLGQQTGGGSRRSVHARSGGRRSPSAAAAKQLLLRLRSAWRSGGAARPRRVAVRFGYDLQSYCQNFDDGGLGSSAHPLAVIPCN
ncbi:hypothetical protein HU200_049429 [Digitaria exilis]|uniref:Uncharacterized protein n=1 Tax=Digitaria exilis TaxID=1010633 RepID=A0A835ARA4_9POAL|nr:hypothetical protein HU200_049429 [Digitaria exilis]CAB3499432.1 unnamed protein product [Digitaria exilis]